MLKNVSIRARLIALVAVLATILVAVGGSGILALRASNEALHTVYADRMVPLGQLDKVIRTINRKQLIITTAVVRGEAHYAQAITELNAAVEEGDANWNAYMATYLTPEEKTLAAEFERTARAFKDDVTAPVLAALAARDTAKIDGIARGVMATRYQEVRKPMNALIQLQLDVGKAEFQAGEHRYERFLGLSLAALAGGLAIGCALAFWLIRSVTRPLDHAVEIAEAVAAGDLTRAVRIESADETGRLLQAMADMQARLSGIVAEVRSGTETIHTASNEISVGNTDLSRRTEEQAASLEETASSMEELTTTVRQNADNARQANQLAASASEHAGRGGAVVEQMVGTMAAIRDSSNRIVDIISVIDGIAFQTNILALNAAVEAARAGEQGRGFAVVAAEVRTLAQRSANAAREIKQLIGDAVDKVGHGTALMDETGASMQQIVDSVKRVADIIGEISAASREQSQGIDQVNHAITQIDEVTQQNAALVEEAAAAAQSMLDQAGALSRAVSVFRIADDSAVAAAPAPVRAPRAVAPAKTALPTRTLRPALAAATGTGDWEAF